MKVIKRIEEVMVKLMGLQSVVGCKLIFEMTKDI